MRMLKPNKQDKIAELKSILQSIHINNPRLENNIRALQEASAPNDDYSLAKLAVYIEILRLSMPELQNHQRLTNLYNECERSLRKLDRPQRERLYADHFISYYVRLPSFDVQQQSSTERKTSKNR